MMSTSKKNIKKNDERKIKPIALALQGGGAHGAFAWGVIDKLLEDGRFDIRGVSGTSAGGMNAVSTIMGLIKGGNEEARRTLTRYWRSMHELANKISPFATTPFDKMVHNYNLDHSLGFKVAGFLQTYFSPYDLNPLNLNPFKDFINDFFDFDLVRNHTERRVFLGTTQVSTGKIKMFTNEELSADAMMASACLPFLFQAVRIDNEYYWDGGYIANPAIFPLIEGTDASDVVLIQLTKARCNDLPRTKQEITDRFKEITYNGCLLREMRAIHFITKLIDEGMVRPGALKRVNMHLIANESVFKELNLSSALNTDWEFLTTLFEEGRKTAHKWIEEYYHHVGDSHSISEEMFAQFV